MARFPPCLPLTQALAGVTVCLALALAANWSYQTIRKPSELFFPINGALDKTPSETWRAYASTFRANSTPLMTPELLAAIAQVEGSGNPLVRTYWRSCWFNRFYARVNPAHSVELASAYLDRQMSAR